eukprot:m.164550 g.164550  ORF g.164550 m.164550 type:complete len:52 (+) comp15240_c0_seq3:40-195(+)
MGLGDALPVSSVDTVLVVLVIVALFIVLKSIVVKATSREEKQKLNHLHKTQ